MSVLHFVRIGALGRVGRFAAVSGSTYPRGKRVVCRTGRGLEVGEVLNAAAGSPSAVDGVLLRQVTPEDDLLLARLEQHRDEAYHACRRLLQERAIPATLMEVEHLFDGQSLYFYFLGEVGPPIEALTQELAETYATRVQFRKFADALTQGCGPDCGTVRAAGCGSGCSECSIASACRPAK
jgi:cell fate regulator YaaT (PSP1 superfamily)